MNSNNDNGNNDDNGSNNDNGNNDENGNNNDNGNNPIDLRTKRARRTRRNTCDAIRFVCDNRNNNVNETKATFTRGRETRGSLKTSDCFFSPV